MSKEQQEVLDDAYNRYRATIIKEFYEDTKELRKWATVEGPGGHTKQEFINKCKTNTEFSQRWGLKIEERELVVEERVKWAYDRKLIDYVTMVENEILDKHVPTKLTTITYNDKTIESYDTPRN